MGTVVGMLGALIIGLSAYFLGVIQNPFSAIVVSVISGTVGCFMDSFLGATFERAEMLTNEHVNLIATIVGAIVGILLI